MTIRKFLAVLFVVCICGMARSQSRINVQISHFENNKGSIIVCLYNKASEFSDKGKPMVCTTLAIANHRAVAAFEKIPPGNYAILAIHDANNNRKFDTNFIGIPKEGYGASQNKLPFAAAPKFADNQFTVTENGTTTCNIKLRYIF